MVFMGAVHAISVSLQLCTSHQHELTGLISSIILSDCTMDLQLKSFIGQEILSDSVYGLFKLL
jgi:hypothetical protein